MQLPSTRSQSFINRIQMQAIIIIQKPTTKQILKEISSKTRNVICIKIEECSAQGTLDLRKIPCLQIQRLAVNRCPGISNILLADQTMMELEQIDLIGNQLEKIPSFVKKCKNLKRINLNENFLKEISAKSFSLQEQCRIQSILIFGNPLQRISSQVYAKVGQEGLLFEWKGQLKAQENLSEQKKAKKQESFINLQKIMKAYIRKEKQSESQKYEDQIKSLIIHKNQTYLKSILPCLNIKQCYKILTMTSKLRKYDPLNIIFERIHQIVSVQEAEKIEKGAFIFQRLMTMNVNFLENHENFLFELSLKEVIKFCNEISLRNSSVTENFRNFISNDLVKDYIFQRNIKNEQDFLYFISFTTNKRTLIEVMRSEALNQFIHSYDFENQEIVRELLELQNCILISKFLQLQKFRDKLFKESNWKGFLKPSTAFYKCLQKNEKKYRKDSLETNTMIHLPEYKPPMSCVVRNDVHDYAILRQYEEFHASFVRKDFKITIRFANKENNVSIASRIKKEINLKHEISTQRKKRKTGINVVNSNLKIGCKTVTTSFCEDLSNNAGFSENVGLLSNSVLIECSEFQMNE